MKLISRKHARSRAAASVLWTCCALLLPGAILSGCSVALETSRPTPVDLTRFQPGQNREYVLERLGQPKSSEPGADGSPRDLYELYTAGAGGTSKSSKVAIEAAADVASLGIAEVISTPVELFTRDKLHSVAFSYSAGKLVRLTDDGQVITSYASANYSAQPAPTADPAPASAQPSATSFSGSGQLPDPAAKSN